MDGIIFDLDGTMWDTTQEAAAVWEQTARKNPLIKEHVTPEKLKGVYGMLLEDIAIRIFPSVSHEVAMETMETCVREQCTYLLEHKGRLLGDVKETLEVLSKQYSLFIVSNCRSGYIETFLEAFQLGKYFKGHLCPGDTGYPKAENIKIIQNQYQLKNPIYVGDTQGDADAAKEAGVPFVYCAYGFGDVKKYDYCIDSFEALVPLTEQLNIQKEN